MKLQRAAERATAATLLVAQRAAGEAAGDAGAMGRGVLGRLQRAGLLPLRLRLRPPLSLAGTML